MGKNNNIIEINGKRYDARTGDVLSRHHSTASSKPKVIATKSATAAPKPTVHDVARQAAKHAPHHMPNSSHTLMRHAVKKPAPGLKRRVKAQGPADMPVKRPPRASQVAKSHLITHFSSVTSDSGTAAQFVSATKPAPKILPIQRSAAAVKPKTTADVLEQAVRQAVSHQQPHKTTKRKSRAGLTSAAAVMLLVIGVMSYQELPNLRLRLASAKAGISASRPGYQPAGYSLGQLSYSTGVIATEFHSNSDDRAYTITQKRSTWDSQTLLKSFVRPIDQNYQTVETGGHIVYLYSVDNATWVNDGIWYVVQGNGSLSNNQLIELVKSL